MQPAEAEEQEEGADDELEARLGYALDDELAEDGDQNGQRYEGRDGSIEGSAPAACETDSQDYGQRLDRLDGGAEKRGPEGEELLAHTVSLARCTIPIRRVRATFPGKRGRMLPKLTQ